MKLAKTRMTKTAVLLTIYALTISLCTASESGLTVDQVLQNYIQALGGQTAIDRISTRQLEGRSGRRNRSTLYWQAPNKVLRVKQKTKEGYDGSSAWAETKRKKVEKLPRAMEEEMETDANPIRYVHLRQLFADLQLAPRESLGSKPMDILTSPNHIGQTKFYFDATSHLLIRIDDFGLNSAYFKHTTEFIDYKEIDGVKIPTRILRDSEEPGAETGELQLLKIEQNVKLNSAMFDKPNIAAVAGGGKR